MGKIKDRIKMKTKIPSVDIDAFKKFLKDAGILQTQSEKLEAAIRARLLKETSDELDAMIESVDTKKKKR